MATFDGDELDLTPGQRLTIRGERMTETKMNAAKTYKVIRDGRPAPVPPPPVVPPPANILGIDFASRPRSGPAWDRLVALSDRTAQLDMSNIDSPNINVLLAKAFRFAATGDTTYRDATIAMLRADIPYTGPSGYEPALQVGRGLAPRVIAASLVGFDDYKATARTLRNAPTGASGSNTASIVTTHERRGNNFSTTCGSSRIATDIFIGDTADLDIARKVHRGYVGETTQYTGFVFGADKSWQAGPVNLGINIRGALISGRDVDGVLPDDQRRAGSFSWPAPMENYVWGALGDLLLTTLLLGTVTYGDSAVRRGYEWMTRRGFVAVGDDRWQPIMANALFGPGTCLTPAGMQDGKSFGLTDWLFA